LGDPAFARWSEPPALSNAGGIAGYRMTAQFLEARTKIYSPNDPDQSWILFNGYLAPCWIRRRAAARWLENNRYSLPPLWMISSRSADGPSGENSIAPRKTKKPSKLEAWAAEQVKCQHKGLKTELYDSCRDECDGWIDKRDGKHARGFSDKTIQRRLDEAAKFDKLDN
jgi:hypothetical protein